MRRWLLTVALALLPLPASVIAQSATLITRVSVIDVRTGAVRAGSTVLIRDGTIVMADATGTSSFGPIVGYSSLAFGVAGTITPGSSWSFQGWYRDPFGPCGSGFNLTHALEVLFSL